jgi:tRNA (cytosine38-C5)-methyltransferase
MVDSENSLWEQYQVPNSVILKSGLLFDIVTPDSTNSCCFTKSYGRYVEGTGSVLQTADKNLQAEEGNPSSLIKLKLRYFTPREIANLHGFPPTFHFPSSFSVKQCFSLLGNSLNVVVVSELIDYLFSE